MLFIRCIVFLLLLLYMNNTICMLVDEISISTLKQLCIKTIREKVKTGDIHELLKKENFEKYTNLPEFLKDKIATFPMFFKLGHEYKYEITSDGRFDQVCLDEDNNYIHLIRKQNQQLILFKMGEKKEINSFAISNFCMFGYKRSLLCWSDIQNEFLKINYMKNSTDIKYINTEYKNEYPTHPYKILNNQRTIFLQLMAMSGNLLFDLNTQLLVINNPVRKIQFDINEKLCLMQEFDNTFTLYNTKDPAKYQKIQTFNNFNHAVLEPNGKQIFISTKENKCALVSLTGKKIFEIENGTNFYDAYFNNSGDYVIVSHSNQNGFRYTIINTNNGAICFSLQLSTNFEVCFYKKFLLVINNNDNTFYLIRIKDLPKINNKLYISNDIKELNNIKNNNRIYIFENVNLHKYKKDKSHFFYANGKYIITKKDYLWKLIHIKSKECVATFENVLNYHFSEPTGKMLYIKVFNEDRRCNKVFYCRNFTLEEFLLKRFIIENITNQYIKAL